jgi:hypothetical protein
VKGQSSAPRRCLEDEVVGAAGVEEGNQRGGTKRDDDLHGVSHRYPSQGLQGETGGFTVSVRGRFVGVFNLHALHKKNTSAKPVVSTRVFFIAVKT